MIISSADNSFLNKSTLSEKVASFLNYFTFGLLGVIFIISNYFSGDITNKFTFFHTLQSLLFGIIATFIALMSGIFLDITSFYHINLGPYNQLVIEYCLKLPQYIFLFTCIFGISAFTGNKFYIPLIKNLTHDFFSQKNPKISKKRR